MKFRFLLLPLLALILLGAGCDRFKHEFEPPTEVDLAAELFDPLQVAFDSLSGQSVEAVMDYFAEDYLNFGATKADRRAWLEGIYGVHPTAAATVTLLDSQVSSDSTAIANWKLRIVSEDSRAVLADSTFSGERLIKRNERWLLKGNQLSCQIVTPPQHVIIDYFTFLTCPNCPVVETKLEELKTLYPNQLSYLEHHFNDQLAIPDNGTQDYYGVFSAPASVVQGKYKLLGNSTEVLDSYLPLVQQLVAEDSAFRFANPIIGVDGQTISGSIIINDLSEGLDYAGLALKVVLIERLSDYTNADGHQVRNVVRALQRVNISEADLSQPVLFTLNSTVPIPDDASLVIYTQTLPDTFENNATIHGGIEIPLDRNVIRFN